MESSLKYNKRLILFIDILGFKNFIEKTDSNNEHAEILIEKFRMLVLTIRNRFYLDPETELEKEISKSPDATTSVTQFSDSVVISSDFNVAEEFERLILDIVSIINSGYFYGFIFRGSVTYGKIIHDSKRLFGPGFNKAFELEKDEAKYPRVIIDKSALNLTMIDYNSDILRETLKIDTDGATYIDPFYKINSSILNKIENILNKNSGCIPCIKEKYDWLSKKFSDYKKLNKIDI